MKRRRRLRHHRGFSTLIRARRSCSRKHRAFFGYFSFHRHTDAPPNCNANGNTASSLISIAIERLCRTSEMEHCLATDREFAVPIGKCIRKKIAVTDGVRVICVDLRGRRMRAQHSSVLLISRRVTRGIALALSPQTLPRELHSRAPSLC
jgi:hypothetical protein